MREIRRSVFIGNDGRTRRISDDRPDSRLFKKAKGHEVKLAFLSEALMETRHGLVVDASVVPGTGTGDRDDFHRKSGRRVTIGGDKSYDTRGFIETPASLGGDAAYRSE